MLPNGFRDGLILLAWFESNRTWHAYSSGILARISHSFIGWVKQTSRIGGSALAFEALDGNCFLGDLFLLCYVSAGALTSLMRKRA